MSLSTTKLIERWQNVRRAEAKKTARRPSLYLFDLVVESLSRTERDVYRWMSESGPVSSGDVAAHFSLSLPHACNLLSHLHQYGLVSRRINPEFTREFLWSIAEGAQ